MLLTRIKALKRPIGERRYNRLFFVAAEGKTERQYLKKLKKIAGDVHIERAPHSSNTAPAYVLRAMKNLLKENKPRAGDQAWLVVDRDNWPEEQLNKLVAWASKDARYMLALSNPCFELWLLLHFEDIGGGVSCIECTRKLKNHIPGYDKDIISVPITRDMVLAAIQRAKLLDKPKCSDWPRDPGVTTMYRLAEEILNKEL